VSSFEPFRHYWKIYGGTRALLKSPYLWLSAVITVGCFPFWLDRGPRGDARPVADALLTVIPALMAFTLAGMAIILALSGQKFTHAIREGGKYDSLFMQVVVLFFHFILVQSIALILAFFLNSYPSQDWLAGFAFFFTTYGVASAIAIAAMLLNISRVYNIAGDEE
jgi:uncharacterized membrane protein